MCTLFCVLIVCVDRSKFHEVVYISTFSLEIVHFETIAHPS